MEKNYSIRIDRIMKDHQDKLSSWELKFFNDILYSDRDLTECQKNRIIEIDVAIIGGWKK